MRFVLLGDDPAVLPLVRAIAGHPEHTLTRAAFAGELRAELTALVPGVTILARWDELLAGDEIDAALIAGHAEDVVLAARQLGQSGTPLVVFPDVRQGAEFVYEMTLVRDDRQVALVPVFPARFDATVEQLREALRAGATGAVLHMELARECVPSGRSGSGPPLVTPAEIERWLLHDADLLRCLAAGATGGSGDYNQVTAIQAGRAGTGVSATTVSLAGDGLPEASWTLRPGTADRWRIAVTTDRGPLVLERAEGTGAASGAAGPQARAAGAAGSGAASGMGPTIGAGAAARVGGPPRDVGNVSPAGTASSDTGERILEHIAAGLSGQAVSPDWIDLTRAFEIVEGSQRSVRRRRTIDLHFETTSERSLFKTRMTALGCGLLSLTLVGVVLLLVLGAVLRGGRDEAELRRLLDDGWTAEEIAADPERLPDYNLEQVRDLIARVERGDTIMSVARIVVFLPLFVFLALQLLVFVARPPRSGGGHPTDQPKQ